MSSQMVQKNYSWSAGSHSRAAYPRLRDKVGAYVIIFFLGVVVAVFSDLVLGISTEIVTYGVFVFVLVLLVGSSLVSWLFEWKRTVSGQSAVIARQVRVLNVAYVEYAKRLNQLEAERAYLIRQSNNALLHTLMNEPGPFELGAKKAKTTPIELEAAGTAERIRRELYQGSRPRGMT